jgi:hypothetical protein
MNGPAPAEHKDGVVAEWRTIRCCRCCGGISLDDRWPI